MSSGRGSDAGRGMRSVKSAVTGATRSHGYSVRNRAALSARNDALTSSGT
jgi:hypothetical protein